MFHAIAEENGNFLVNEERCMGCGVCHPSCPVDALSLIEIRPADFIPD